LPSAIRSHCVEGYFAKQKSIAAVTALKRHPLPKLRHDATGWFLYTEPQPKRRGRRRQYDGKVNSQDLHRFESLGPLAEKPPIPLYTALVWPVSLKRRLPVGVLSNRKAVTNPRYLVLASTDLALAGDQLVELDVARFPIAFLFRDRKPFTGLAACQSRAETVLHFHFKAALAMLTRARAEQLRTQTDPSPRVFSMARWKQRQFNERLREALIENLALDPRWVKNHPGYEELRTYGAIAA